MLWPARIHAIPLRANEQFQPKHTGHRAAASRIRFHNYWFRFGRIGHGESVVRGARMDRFTARGRRRRKLHFRRPINARYHTNHK